MNWPSKHFGAGLLLIALVLPATAQNAGQAENNSALGALTKKDRGRLARMDASRVKGLSLAQLGDPKNFKLISEIIGAKAVPINLLRLQDNWRCRTFSLGGKLGPRFYASKTSFFRCRIVAEGNGYTVKKLSGSMSWLGRLRKLGPRRMLYYGTAIARGDRHPFYPDGQPYGHRVGILEQIGRNRLRLEMPEPNHSSASSHDLIELVRGR